MPRAGRDYAARRNYDLGPGQHSGVSNLSPYIRHRILTEEEVLSATLSRFALSMAQKFVQEVFWRTYWKGWLEMRPGVWDAYQCDLRRALDDVQTQAGLRSEWEAACRGETGIDCFDHWARELAETGYLHNHARMWFASIWIFTFRLPWELGADFFLRHLLDGDPASNTLSWRWIAGIQTSGKTYLARPSNIAEYTEWRFTPTGLATAAPPVSAPSPPPPQPIPPTGLPDPSLRTGFLLHVEDLSPAFVLGSLQPAATAILRVETEISPLHLAPHLPAFLDAAVGEAARRHDLDPDQDARDATTVADWARENGLRQLVTAYAPVGPVASLLRRIAIQSGLPVVQVRRDYDSLAWPHADRGFFRFKDKIPELVANLKGPRAA